MPAQEPEIAGLGDGLDCLINLKLVVRVWFCSRLRQDQIDLGNFEAGDGDIEITVDHEPNRKSTVAQTGGTVPSLRQILC